MLFKEKKLYESFIKDGFVVIQIYDDQELNNLHNLYKDSQTINAQGLVPSLRIGNAEQNISLHHQIAEIVTPAFNRLFDNYDFVANHFITKTAKNNSEFRLHQDWNVVNENEFIAAHVWAPMQATNPDNGGLFVVEGSHNFFNNYRSGSLSIPFIDTTEKVKSSAIFFDLNPGEAIVYNQCLFHGSTQNKSPENRKTLLCSIKPKQAKMMYYHTDDCNEKPLRISGYEINPEFLFRHISLLEKGLFPDNEKLINEITYFGITSKEINNNNFESFITRLI